MEHHFKVTKGLDIVLSGEAGKDISSIYSTTYSIKPTDFLGMYRPKIVVKPQDIVKAGTPLFYDKKLDKVLYTSPISGEVIAVKRGEKRKPLEIIILGDKKENIEYENFNKYSVSDIETLSPEEIEKQLLKSGLWPFIIQRPFAIVANPEIKPQAIYISCFDSAPLAPDYNFLYKKEQLYFEKGLKILHKLTKAMIYLGIDGKNTLSPVFNLSENYVKSYKFSGKHPAGNVGTQIYYINPLRKGKTVWTINPLGVIQIGKLFMKGIYDASRVIAVAGSAVSKPQYYQTITGVCVDKFLEHLPDNVRIISGNVLTGQKISLQDHLCFYDQMITVIPEGNKDRFFLTDGWLAPITKRLSFHRAIGLLSFLNSPKKKYELDTSMNGETRPFVLTGHFEKVIPFNIYLMYLLKAILARDYDEMEALGILELAEEDVALAEFVDVSKHNIQEILREGINLLREA